MHSNYSNYNKFYSPMKHDSESKDLLINQLKNEIFELKQNENDFGELSAQLKNLEHRYMILNEEKYRNEQEYRNRNDINMKTVANLRTDIDALKSNITEKHIEIQELRAENMAIKEIADHRQLEIQRYKSELGLNHEKISKGTVESNNLNSELYSIKDEKRKLLEEIEVLTNNCDTLINKNSELEKLLREYDYDKQTLVKQNLHLKSALDQHEIELKSKSESIRYVNIQLQDSQNQNQQLQSDIEEIDKLKEKYKQESLHFQKQSQIEANKNFDQGTQLLNLEGQITQKDIQIQEYMRELENIRIQYGDTLEQCEHLAKELEIKKRHYDLLQMLNSDLVQELENFSEQDDHFKKVIQARRSKVQSHKIKSEEFIRRSINDNGSSSSPNRYNNNSIN